MIIYDGEKYSCVSCIRGHRSTTCRHSSRMLVKVRTKGRPSAKTARQVIFVDASSQVLQAEEAPSSCCAPLRAPRSCSKMNKQPILFLRARSTQQAFLVDGALKIVIEDTSGTSDTATRLVSEKDYLKHHLKLETSQSIAEAVSPPKLESLIQGSYGNPLESGVSTFSTNDTDVVDAAEIHDDSLVELFTHKGVYLSSQCNCEDDNCPCVNCLIHRKDDELESYVKGSGVPLSNVGNGRLSYPHDENSSHDIIFKQEPHNCDSDQCSLHPPDIIPFNNIFLYGLVNLPLNQKSVIKYKHKLIPSNFWWQLLKEELPFMAHDQRAKFDLVQWFENTIASFDLQIPEAGYANLGDNQSMGLLSNA
ncbi:LADA_0G12772g1_1 [Lachancea dasiensis]|uniref:LADA_0G12772g1_1 n=1 Tax=Lachancea dasiensis TaxID=1072105 RepID=A0A1G4JVM8_9SACH|nr:LADA_0G12772g1_1 [Lachancea dasiensis]